MEFRLRPASPALTATLERAYAVFQKGKYDDAAQAYSYGYQAATQRGERDLAARFLWGIGNCHFAKRQYRQAIESFLSARRRFELSGNQGQVNSLNGSLASVYSQLGEYDAALDAAKRGLEGPPAADLNGRRARLLQLLAEINALRGRFDEALPLFYEGILEADRVADPDLISNTWDLLGVELLLRKQLVPAEEALLNAYRIRKLNRLPGLGWSYRNLGLLRLEQGDLRSSSVLLDLALAELKSGRGRIPEWRFYQARGRLRLTEGNPRKAFDDFRLALELVRNYRLSVPTSDATRVSLEGVLQEVYASFVETGNRLSAETGGLTQQSETFEALEENRAASLAARLGERKELSRKMAPAYLQRLAELQSAETAALLDGGDGPRRTMQRLRGAILELEAGAGVASPGLSPGLLQRVRRSLDAHTVLLSFHLAQPSSWLWAVSQSGLSLYSLPDRTVVAAQARQFRQAVLTRDAAAGRLGADLYRTLFGALGPQYRSRSRWLLSLDQDLFGIPFAALVSGGEPNAPVYLIERHSIRIVSGAAVWSGGTRRDPPAGGFVGVGDAVYNTADARWRGPSPAHWRWKAGGAAASTLGLSRLAGSGAEVAACAREWKTVPLLLQGRDATKENVHRALETRPSVVHFAAHVLQRPERSADAMIALSVSDAGEDQLLGPAEIGAWNLDTGLIVLSGCGSGAAMARPGAGLMGMTRAWLMAGARAVVATEWSTPDDVGVFFGRFYRRLQHSTSTDPAEALQAAQIETLRSDDWRSQPGFWAAYFAVGNY